jgi:two-component system sensor histidine kinase PilS (NtrC family)
MAALSPGAGGSRASESWFIEILPQELGEGSVAFERMFRAFLAARTALGVALVVAQLVAVWLGSSPAASTLGLSLLYAVEAMVVWLLPWLSRVSSPRWWASIGLDLVLFGVLHALDNSGVNYGALFVMPVLMAGVLSPRLLVLATASMATLWLLADAGWQVLRGADVGLRMTQAGLVGSGLFVVGLLASELASRLAREERAARGSMALARQQEQLNRLVIDEMQEGVLVLDRRGRVRAANPAARSLLGGQSLAKEVVGTGFSLRSQAAWQPLVEAVQKAFAQGDWPEAGGDVLLRIDPDALISVRLRLRFTRRRESDGSEDLCVLFVEDSRALLARTRQEKLAAMGRVSAGIAHEIRNPLAAIAQANALLAEDLAGDRAQQLTRMVASNVERLKRLVDDVVEVAPGVPPQSQPVDVSQLVVEVCAEWLRVNELPLPADGPVLVQDEVPPRLVVAFEAEHLRRVLVNLLDNGLRHAGVQAGAVRVRLAESGGGWVRLDVRSAGAPIPPEVERHLFEPFFSTRSRGSGLGLYICRELCERHGARIEYRRAQDTPPGNDFIVHLRALVPSN